MTTTTYLIDDFIYTDALDSLYNMPRAWISPGHFRPIRVKNPHRRNREAFLFYRPEIEAFILAHKSAYTARLHLRMARFDDTRGRLYLTALERAETVKITVHQPKNMAYIHDMIQRHHRLNPHLGTFPADWQPSPADLFTFFRFYHTDYIAQINTFRNTPGAGDIWLKLRLKTDVVVLEAMSKLMDIEYAQLEGVTQ